MKNKRCEMCNNLDPAQYIAMVRIPKVSKNIEYGEPKEKYLCQPCARDLDKLGWAFDIRKI
jgi:hypothetical protein